MKGGYIIKKYILVIIAVIVLISTMSVSAQQIIIPKSAIRFRVIANSNSIKDQNIKIKVRDNLQKTITSSLENSKSIEDSRNILKNNILLYQETVNKTLKELNVNQTSKVKYGKKYFPEKNYKGVSYEAGKYESLVVTLGDGKGDNWWCVLFPPLCLLDIDEEDKSEVEYKFFVKELIDKYFN